MVDIFRVCHIAALFNSHELTSFFSPSLLRKEGEGSNIQSVLNPSLHSREGGEFVVKVILLGAILFYTEKLFNIKPYNC